MATILESSERVSSVRIDGLALLKIVKHCHESLPHMVTGSLLGLNVGNGILEISHAFPFPAEQKNSSSSNNTANATTTAAAADGTAASAATDMDDVAALEGHEFQLEMMRMLREVNVDNNCVGWYQSMYLGIFSTSSLLENQLQYQTDLSENAVVILYDPMQTANGNLVLKCLRLTDECLAMKSAATMGKDRNIFLDPKRIFEQVPVTMTNPGLVRAFLMDLAVPDNVDAKDHIRNTMTAVAGSADQHQHHHHSDFGLHVVGADPTLDRLDMSFNPYLEKHLEFLSGWVEDLAAEQQKFQYYSRQLARSAGGGGMDNKHKKSNLSSIDKAAAWASPDAPRRLESLLIANQIAHYCDQMDQFTAGSLSKLFLAGGMQTATGATGAATSESK